MIATGQHASLSCAALHGQQEHAVVGTYCIEKHLNVHKNVVIRGHSIGGDPVFAHCVSDRPLGFRGLLRVSVLVFF